jgi:hypothetical protein
MNMRKFSGLWVGAVAVLAVACANQMEPAQKAIDGINSAVAAAESAGATKYLPDELGTVKGKLTELKAAFDKKDYAGVLRSAPALLTETQSLIGATTSAKDNAVKAASAEWTTLSASLPTVVAAVKGRVDALSRERRVAAGIDLESAKSGLAEATSLWDKAQAAAAAGNIEDAVDAARQTKEKAEAAAAALKLKLPGA